MSIDEQHVALPKLYGAPAYARPTPVVATSPKPLDPDDLPIEALQTDDERELVASLPARTWTSASGHVAPERSSEGTSAHAGGRATALQPRPLVLKKIAGRLFKGG